MMDEPAWKRNGRAGPFDWWMGCETHGGQLDLRCLSCQMANDMNTELRAKLDREALTSAPPTKEPTP